MTVMESYTLLGRKKLQTVRVCRKGGRGQRYLTPGPSPFSTVKMERGELVWDKG
jgi:hypothetical protein